MASSAYGQTLGVTILEDGTHLLPFAASVLGRPGFLHGGAIGGLLALACDAIAEFEGDSHDAATTTMNFLRGGRERDTHAIARIAARTARFLIVEASAWQESADKPIASMRRTYLRRQ